jgi:hypothetical protein
VAAGEDRIASETRSDDQLRFVLPDSANDRTITVLHH